MKISKKILSLLLCSVMVLGSVAVGGKGLIETLKSFSFFANAESSGIYSYIIENGEAIIIGCDESVCENINIPSVLENYPVTKIDSYAFGYCAGITSVIIPDTIKSIGYCAFANCTNLTNIKIPDSVINIDSLAFEMCCSLKSITIPNSIKHMGNCVFSSCYSLESISVDENNQYYSSDDYGVLFNKSKSILIQYPIGNIRTSYTIPDSVKTIEMRAFEDCCCTSINIPYGVNSIENYAFAGCKLLSDVNFPGSLRSIGNSAFSQCENLLNVIIPDSVEHIGGYAWSGCAQLESVKISNGIKAINQETFSKCVKLTHIELPDSVNEINAWAFAGCTSLSDVSLGDNIEHISYAAFDNTACYNNSVNWVNGMFYIGKYLISANEEVLENVNIREGTRLIADETFEFNKHIKNVTFPKSIKIIGDHAFTGCTGLEKISFPENLTDIGYAAFSGCTLLSNIEIGCNVNIGNEAFDSTKYYFDVSNWNNGILYLNNYLLSAKHDLKGSLSIRENTTVIVDGAFSRCFELSEIKIPNSVIYIGENAFQQCKSLTNIIIPDSVTSIGDYAFYACTNLSSVILPKSVQKIGRYALGYTYTFTSIEVNDKYAPFTIYCYEDTAGQKYAVDNNFDYTIIREIPGIADSETYGMVCFTVTDATTNKPIENANISFSIDEKSYVLSTDKKGKCAQHLPIGELSFSVFADGYNVRNLKYTIVKGENDIPQIGLSSGDLYDAKLTSKEMTYEEIVVAGIDTEADENKHVFKYQLDISFDAEIDIDSLIYYLNADGEVIKGETKEGDSGKSIVWVPNYKTGEGLKTGGFFYDKEKNISLIPFSENFFLIIRGSVKWLKEMFDVEMLVINNSSTDTLENIETTLELPEGLSLAEMVDGEQTLKQAIGTIPENGFKSAHWYVCGDKAGSYNLSAKLTGMVMPFSEEINKTFTTENALQVWAGDALHLDFEFPDAAFYGDDYPITVTLTNVSDKPLYQLSNVLQITEDMQYFYSNGETKEKLSVKNIIGSGILDAFNPGDKIIIETSANIFFESAIIEAKKNQLVNLVDELDRLYKAYKCITSAYKVTETLIKSVSGACKAIDDFKPSLVEEKLGADKAKAVEKLYSSLAKLRKYTKSDNKIVDKVWDLFDCAVSMDVSMDLEKMSKDPVSYFDDKKVEEIYKLYEKVKAVGDACEESVNKSNGVETYKFDLCDSIKTFISAIPVKFFASSIIMTASENNTADIPYSISTYPAGVHYFGVTNVSKYVMSIANLAVAKLVKGELPWYLKMFVDIDNIMNTDESLEYVKTTENEIKAFQVKDSTGEITWTVRVERNKPKSKAYKTTNTNFDNSSIDGFELKCSNENAIIKNGVMTFKGEGFIYVTPISTDSGTLYIENSEGAKYIYNLSVVEPHSCTADEQEIIINPTKEYDGIAVKRCSVCDEILEIIPLSCDLCGSHEFNDWTTVYAGDCETRDIIQHTCTNCGYYESDVGDYGSHIFTNYIYNDDATTEHDGTETAKCDLCGETDTRTVPGTQKNPTENSVIKAASVQTIDYRSIVTITATATDVPEGYHLALYINGAKVKDGDNKSVSYTYGEIKSDINYTVKIVDSNSNVQKDSSGNDLSKDSRVTVNAGFFKKLVAFFKGLFGALPKVEVKP